MISIDDYSPSDPSSSHNHQQKQDQIFNDLKISDTDLKFLDVDLDDINNQLPKFSIRDYVSGLRSKDIASNWPFSPTSLQLCLKHGVKNLLPPFESLDSLRNNSSLTKCSLENRLTDEELIKSFDGKPTNDQFKLNEKLALKSLTTNSSSTKGQQRSKEKQPSSSSQKRENASCHIKKSKFVMKLNSGSEQRVEDITPNSFIVSETMASKVCPVCKTFSSSSNTTLNAHIDQCLTGEGTMKWTDHHNPKVIVKHKVKPRKMRLMLDIYKTAPHCTIEELDRRNGTSWANNSSFPAQEFQFQGEEENNDPKEENNDPKTTKINHTIADNEGDVYIDTNGTKVRILSVPKIGSSDNNGARKLVKGSKFIMGKKKNNIIKQKHHQKYLKVSPNAKKLSPPKHKARSDREKDVVMAENCDEDPKKVADLGITRPPWACSKRTIFSKKFIDKNRKVELPTKGLVIESDKSYKNRKKMETSLLNKQPLKSNKMMVFRKNGSSMHHDDDDDDDYDYDDDYDSQDACPSQHSDDVDTRSKGKKLSSLTKNLSFPATKFNLKRIFSSVEKSGGKTADGSSQDSLKEQSRTEEHEVSKKNQDSRSISSKSFSNEESSVGIQTVKFDELRDVESVRNDTLLPISNIPTPSFIGLSTSFDPEFSKQDCIELYQDPICSTNRAPNDVEKHENYFQEVDPIPIPGPPGSFLPASPGGEMVSEEQIQETRVLSSENQHHHDTMDQESMSNSPVSTVSNSRSTSVQDDAYKKSFFNNDSFKNDQPCCCSRKEVALNYQDSYILRKQPIESNRNTPINGFNFKSEIFSLNKYPNSLPLETASFPTNKKFSVSSDCDSGSPSKPVLRLMGKNLTVVKSDEDAFRPPQSSQQHPQRPLIFSQYPSGFDSQNMRNHDDLRPIYDGFMAPLDRYGHVGAYMGPNMSQVRPHHGHNALDFQAVGGRNVYNPASSSKPNKEIIIIDDSPENEDDDSMRNEFLKRNQGQMNPLYTMYPSQISSHPYTGGSGGSGGSTVFRGGGFQSSMANNGDIGKWNMRSSSQSSSMSNLRSSTVYYPPSYP